MTKADSGTRIRPSLRGSHSASHPRAHRQGSPALPLLGLDSPAGPAEAERGGCCPLLLPEEAEELLEPLFLSMSEAVAAVLGELCGINGGLGGGGGRSGAGAAGTQAHGVQGRRGSAAAAVLGLHGDIFPCFLTWLLKLGRETAGWAVEPGGSGDRGGEGGRGSEVRAGPGGAEAAGKGEPREGMRAPPAGRTRSPAAGQGRGLAVLVSGTGVSDTATDTRLWAEAELLREWRRVAKQHLEEPGWSLYIMECGSEALWEMWSPPSSMSSDLFFSVY